MVIDEPITKISLSTVTPVYAGHEYLQLLVGRLAELRKKWADSGYPVDLTNAVFVNDDSRDDSLELLYRLQQKHSWITIVNLSRNFGQHQATVAGLLHTASDWVVTLDEDLQHNPDFIETLLETTIARGMDICYANPEKPVHQSWLRDRGSRVWKATVALLTGNWHVREFNSFRLMRGNLARAAASVCSHGTYFDIALCWFSDRITVLKLPLKDERFIEGKTSGYTLRKLFSHARRLIISSETKVLRIGAVIGLLAIAASTILGSKILLDKLLVPESILVQGWTSLILTVLFFSGLITVLLGVILEYLSVILLHTQGKPTFFEVDRRGDQLLRHYYGEESAAFSTPEED